MSDKPSKRKSLNKDGKILARLFSFCRKELPTICLGFTALIVNSITNLTFPRILGKAVDQSEFMNDDYRFKFLLGSLGIFSIGSIASYVRIYCLGAATESISSKLRKLVFQSYIGKNMDYFDENKKGQLLSVLEKDVQLASEVLTEKLSSGLRSINSAVNGSIILYTMSPYLFTVSISLLPLVGIVAMKLNKSSKRIKEQLRQVEASITTFALERFTSITTIRLNGRENYEITNYSSMLNTVDKLTHNYDNSRAILNSFINFSTNISLCAVLYMGGHLIRQGKMTPGDLTKFTIQSAFVGLGFSGLSLFYGDMTRGLDAASRIFNITDIDESIVTSTTTTTTTSVDPNISSTTTITSTTTSTTATATATAIKSQLHNSPSIHFKDIIYQYKGRNEPVFNKLSLSIPPRQMTVIAGKSGAGKSTMMALITGLYKPLHGQILFGSSTVSSSLSAESQESVYDITALDVSQIRKYVGVVEQSIGLLSGTITNNIAYGKEGASMEEIEHAAKQADAHDFIMALPDGYNTQIGEIGSYLSGGQKARIALARALVRDPLYLLLDEATSSLDRKSEIDILATLQRLSKTKTILIFTHSEVVMKAASMIYVLEHGRIIGSGTYEQLNQQPSILFDLED